MQSQLQLIWSNLQALGAKKIAVLLGTAVLIFALIGTGAVYVNRPAFETLYVGLDRDDINRIGIVLSDAGIKYDVDADGTTVLVESGRTSKARMILAEKGLPGSAGSGYELFDNLGSLGLTSFMQEVTRVRVLEGEIARSIQAISGIKAARVHIVQPDRRSFGTRNREATASVLVRTDTSRPNSTGYAIRHLVAAAVPGLSVENVTVLDAEGKLIASGDDPAKSALNSSMTIQRMVEEQLKNNVAAALSPYLGGSNFRVNVQAIVDTDRRQIEETIFDPDSRIERSVQIVKTQDSTNQKSAGSATSVEQNLPNTEAQTTAGPQSSQDSERREETTNYELNSKKIATVSNGYSVKRLSASIILNKSKLSAIAGAKDGATATVDAESEAERLEQIKKVAMAAIGFDESRGDVIDIAAVEFSDDLNVRELPETSLVEKLVAQAGSALNSIAFLIATVLLIFFGIRPLVNSIVSGQNSAPQGQLSDSASATTIEGPATPQDQLSAPDASIDEDIEPEMDADTQKMLDQMSKSPQDRLGELVEKDPEGSAKVLQRWIRDEAA